MGEVHSGADFAEQWVLSGSFVAEKIHIFCAENTHNGRWGSKEVKPDAGMIDREYKTVLTFWTVRQARAHTGGKTGCRHVS